MKNFIIAVVVSAVIVFGAPLQGAAAPKGGPSVNINTADLAELETLPGIGKVTAGKIVAYRIQYGKFSTPDDLVKVKGVGPKTLEKIRGKIIVK